MLAGVSNLWDELPARFRSPAHCVIGRKSYSDVGTSSAIGSKRLAPGTLRSYFRPPPEVIERWCAWGSSARDSGDSSLC
jgi:hypothetical protein